MVQAEDPPDALRVLVTAWVLSRFDHPYQGVRREGGFDNLRFGVVPGSKDKDGNVVVCSYFIFEREQRVRCHSFATLTLPI